MYNPFLWLIRIYQWTVSPFLPPSCRFVPSCSEYALQAVEIHGLFYGGKLTVKRLLRCHPFAKPGYDPVPGAKSRKNRLSLESVQRGTVPGGPGTTSLF